MKLFLITVLFKYNFKLQVSVSTFGLTNYYNRNIRETNVKHFNKHQVI